MRIGRLGAAVFIMAAATACGAGSAATSAPHHHAAPAFNARVAEVKACRIIAAWQASNAADTFNSDPAATSAQNAATGTPLENDLGAWLRDMGDTGAPDVTAQASTAVGAECGALGVELFKG